MFWHCRHSCGRGRSRGRGGPRRVGSYSDNINRVFQEIWAAGCRKTYQRSSFQRIFLVKTLRSWSVNPSTSGGFLAATSRYFSSAISTLRSGVVMIASTQTQQRTPRFQAWRSWFWGRIKRAVIFWGKSRGELHFVDDWEWG